MNAMKRIPISYAAACAEWNADRDGRRGFREKWADTVAGRLPGGEYAVRLRHTAATVLKTRSRDCLRLFCVSFAEYVCGRSLTRRLFGRQERAARETGQNLLSYRIPCRPSGVLYHITDENNLDSIREQGLVAGVYSGQKYVFLTADPKAMRSFLLWKTVRAGRDATYRVLEIDAKRLAQQRPLWYYNLNEIVTERVEPQFIRWE